MVTQITLGNYFNINGRTVLGGSGGSGLNTQALIEALAAGKRVPALRLQDTVTLNNQKTSALIQLGSLVKRFQEAANFLRNPPGVANAAANAFQYARATVTSSAGGSGSSYLSVNASPGAARQDYTINEITSLAKAKKQATGDINIADANSAAVFASPGMDSGLFKAGTFTLNGVEITLNTGDTLNAVAAKFNAVKDTTGIAASIIKIEDGKFQLSFTAAQTGTANSFDFNNLELGQEDTLVDAGGVFGEITITDKQVASDAVFTLNGVEITRSSNSITDVIDGLTFTLLQVTPEDTELTVEVKSDTQVAKGAVINFLNAYNDLKIFAAKQQELAADGTFASSAVLANNQTLRSILFGINSHLASIASRMNIGDPPKPVISFSDLPVSDNNPLVRNVLTLDEDGLASLLADNFEEVRTAFEFNFVSDNPALRVFSRTNAVTATAFSMQINPFATQTSNAITPRASQTTSVITVADADTAIVFDSPDGTQLQSGTISLNGQDIVLTEGDTLNDVVDKFNLAAGDSGVSAHLIEVAAGQFRIAFTSDEADLGDVDFTSMSVDPDGVFGNFTFATATGADAAIAFGTPDAGGFGVGTVTVGGQTIDIEAGDSLNDIVAKFTAVAGDSNLSVSLEDLGDGQYQLVFTSTVTGGAVNFDLTHGDVDPGGVFGNLTFDATRTFQATYDTEGGPVTVDFTAEAISGGGSAYILTGPAGTPFEGLKLIYGGGLSSTAAVTIAQGFADKIYNAAAETLDPSQGGLIVEIDALRATAVKLTEQIQKIEEQVVRFREQMLVKFTALEQALSRINSLLQVLDANDQARRANFR